MDKSSMALSMGSVVGARGSSIARNREKWGFAGDVVTCNEVQTPSPALRIQS